MTSVRVERISKYFAKSPAVADADFAVSAGELFFLLGPSGCGKSTLLRLIAGLLSPTQGRILFNDRDVTNLTTDKRNAVMVFQSYALWPHMSVRENVGFGLNVRKLPRDQQEKRIDEVLRLTRLEQLSARKPNELSGGQQQRVALARALAVRPQCLLLDEPLSNLDAKLRQEMRGEIRKICKTEGVTTIYVTHDQKEALSVADRIAVMNAGRVVQIGAPAELYHRPSSSFVADFIGQSNLIGGKVIGRKDGQLRVETAAGPIRAASEADFSGEVMLSIRPEQMRLAAGPAPVDSGLNRLEGDVVETTFLGEASEHVLLLNGQKIKVVSAPPVFDPPKRVTVEFDPKDALVLRD